MEGDHDREVDGRAAGDRRTAVRSGRDRGPTARDRRENGAWRRWFEENGVDPLRLTYEELVADPTATARRVLELVGVDVPTGFAGAPGTEQQADAVNEEWIRRYRELVGRSGSQAASTT